MYQIKKTILKIIILFIFLVLGLFSELYWKVDKKNIGCIDMSYPDTTEKTFIQLFRKEVSLHNQEVIQTSFCPLTSSFIITNQPNKYHKDIVPVYLFDIKSSKDIYPNPVIEYATVFSKKSHIPNQQFIHINPRNLKKQISEITKYIIHNTYISQLFWIHINKQNGLGNQMFNYASSKSYGLRFNKKIYFNFENDELTNAFQLSEKPSSIKKIHYLKNKRLLKYNGLHVEKTDKKIFFNDSYTHLTGTLQSYKNFQKELPEILKSFQFRPITDEANQKIALRIQQENSVSIHIRRGDYLVYQNKYPNLSHSSYYQNAVNYIINYVQSPVFYVFTNDPTWVRQNFHIGYPYTLIDWNMGENSFRDMQLMSLCKHNIIANSTFSWWAALLNSNPNKLVLYPDIWIFDDPSWLENLRVPSWIEIETGLNPIKTML